LELENPMRLRTLTAIAITTGSLAAAPAALARTSTVGNANGMPTMNICVAGINCTYVNYKNGKPTDVVKRTGTVTGWSLNAGSDGGKVQLRVLRPVHGGKFKAIRSSAVRNVSKLGLNTFPAHLGVRKGDVLALSNSTSGIYMAQTGPGTEIRYFGFGNPLADGATGAPDRTAPQLHLLLSAKIHS
jgi:hypothetical protein